MLHRLMERGKQTMKERNETDGGRGKESFLEDRMANSCCHEMSVRNGAAGLEDKERREAASTTVRSSCGIPTPKGEGDR